MNTQVAMNRTVIIKFIGLAICSLFISVAQAQERDVEKMMQQLTEMQQCLANIDQSQMQHLEQQSQSMQTRILSLCSNGNQQQAMNEAIKFAEELSKSSVMQQLNTCLKLVPTLNQVNPLQMWSELPKDLSICGV